MGLEAESSYDVIIMGGGPAGATLGALLCKDTDLRVAIFEKERFPREHIGESFAHPLIPVLEESGALSKVMASECWVQKFGGFYNWDDQAPSVALFDHAAWQQDGVYRWSMHVNRSEFDHILLDHARSTGVEVFEDAKVVDFESDDSGCTVITKDGVVRAKYFVDASGRQSSVATKSRRSWLSSYRNIAIWQHFVGGRPAQLLDGDWNLFRKGNLSPIGCFAFEDGWCWYIPVPKIVDGVRTMTHSIGIVTIPAVLRELGKDYTDPAVFGARIRRIPILRDLVQNVAPIAEGMLTASNYSMINHRLADLERRWMLVGDAAYFVDPLFSSGVAFAAAHASAAAMVLKATLGSAHPRNHVKDLWQDLDSGWRGLAESFALSIDQWYHAIGNSNPGSVYWRSRGSSPDLNIREQTFQALLDTGVVPDLLQVLTKGSQELTDLADEGPLARAIAHVEPNGLADGALVELAPGVAVRSSVGVDLPGFRAYNPPAPFTLPPLSRVLATEFWKDPLRNGPTVPSPHRQPIPCHRFSFEDRPGTVQVRCLDDREDCMPLWRQLLDGPVTYGQLRATLAPPQLGILTKLLQAGMVVVRADHVALKP